jgi:hypothetical protein
VSDRPRVRAPLSKAATPRCLSASERSAAAHAATRAPPPPPCLAIASHHRLPSATEYDRPLHSDNAAAVRSTASQPTSPSPSARAAPARPELRATPVMTRVAHMRSPLSPASPPTATSRPSLSPATHASATTMPRAGRSTSPSRRPPPQRHPRRSSTTPCSGDTSLWASRFKPLHCSATWVPHAVCSTA